MESFSRKFSWNWFHDKTEYFADEDVDKLLQDEMLDSCDSPAVRKVVRSVFSAVFDDLCKRLDNILDHMNSYVNGCLNGRLDSTLLSGTYT